MRSLAVIALALAAAVGASPFETHLVHEKRTVAPQAWSRQQAAHPNAVLPMRIALAQSNMDKGYEVLDDISDPSSPNFGKHWSADSIAELFASSDETIEAVKAWLVEAGIHHERISLSSARNWIKFDASVEEAERLLKTKYHMYTHDASGKPHVACDDYSVPAAVSEHVDFITPTVHFDAKVFATPADETDLSKRAGPDIKPGTPGSGSLPKQGTVFPNNNSLITQLSQCDIQITPNCLRALYEFPPNFFTASGNSYGIVEYTPQAYVPSDLDLFFANFSPKAVGQRPIFDSIDGGVDQQTEMGFELNGESDLDLEYAMTLVYPQKVTLYQAGDLVEGASFNNFLDAIDGSYCTYEGGDNSTYDATYPDTAPGGYNKPENCGTYAATKVISTSYSYDEAELTPAYEQRQCNEYMKLGMMGVTVLYSSGDYGVAGNLGQCINPDGSFNSGGSGRFNPSFPGTCPYITSVGATQVKPGTNILVDLVTGTQPEQACETIIYSGGGFSNVFPLPSYQKSAVQSYFKNYKPTYSSAQYNNSMQTRGYPDVSANGANYVVVVDGSFQLVYGTSASSPTFGSIVTLINQARMLVGKGSVGFMNPTIYQHTNVFNDIVQGGNQGCGTPGFSAEPGWDPVTGLGTPNFPKLTALYLGLP